MSLHDLRGEYVADGYGPLLADLVDRVVRATAPRYPAQEYSDAGVWNKEAFEVQSREIQTRRRQIRAENRPEEEMDALFREQKEKESRLLAANTWFGNVGAFEGAMYEAKGYYRPQIDCIMFSRNDVPFCAVCRRAIERVIDLYSTPRARAAR